MLRLPNPASFGPSLKVRMKVMVIDIRLSIGEDSRANGVHPFLAMMVPIVQRSASSTQTKKYGHWRTACIAAMVDLRRSLPYRVLLRQAAARCDWCAVNPAR